MLAVIAITVASASTHYGLNNYTYYRLPWQHGQSHGLTQGYDTCSTGGDHCGTLQKYALDFQMPTDTRVLGITEGYACQTSGSGLGNYVVQKAPGYGRGGEDYYFYGHLNNSWVAQCSQGWTWLWQGQVGANSDNTGNVTGSGHLHIAVQNPGNTCYCVPDVSVPFPPLSGINFGTYTGINPCPTCAPTEYFVSDSVMPGDDQAIPQPNSTQAIFDRWYADGGLNQVGSPRNNGGGPGVHGWGNGVVQDFAGPAGPYNDGTGAVMLKNFTGTAWYVHNVIWPAYISQQNGGATGWLGYPTIDEFYWFS
jgi:hypothetical protein